MQSNRPWLSWTWLCAVVTLLGGCDNDLDRPKNNPSSLKTAIADLDPIVSNILDPKLQGFDKAEQFEDILKRIARKHGWNEQLEKCKQGWRVNWDCGQAFQAQHASNWFVIVILGGWTQTTPGNDVQTLFLLDHRGRLLDLVSCSINSRLSRTGRGHFHTVVVKPPELDGAEFVIRLDGESARGNFHHYIQHQTESNTFSWETEIRTGPTKWDMKGLCRLKIENKLFRILFPRLSEPKMAQLVRPSGFP